MVWNAAVELAVQCYAATRSFPGSEAYGMTSQIRRSASSVAANIAEGHGRESTAVFVHFLRVAQGSLKELETHIVISGKVGLMPAPEAERLLGASDEIGRMLRSMVRSLQKKI